MAKRKITTDDVIDKAEYLFRTRGYHNTSIFDIAAACDLSKASIYHHISSKKELALAAIERVQTYLTKHLFDLAYDETHSIESRITAFVDVIENYFVHRDGGCLMIKLALEKINDVAEFEAQVREYFDDWTKAFTHLLSTRYDQNQAKILAEDFIAQIHGAILVAQIFKSYAPLKRIGGQLVSLFKEPELAKV